MKKVVSALLRIACSLAVLIGAIYALDHYLDVQIAKQYAKQAYVVDRANGLPEKDKGNALLQEALSEKGMLLLGSSELSSPVPQNPKNLFPNQFYPHPVQYVGHAGVQNALHGMFLGANSDVAKKSDLVLVESMQWYFPESSDAFMSNFSELLFYEFLQNDQISEDNKQYLCHRFMEMDQGRVHDVTEALTTKTAESAGGFVKGMLGKALQKSHLRIMDGTSAFPQTHLLAKLYVAEDIGSKILRVTLSPYYQLRYTFLRLKDKFDVYQYLRKTSRQPSMDANTIKAINWQEIYSVAEKQGKAACTNNALYVDDEYYTKYLADKYEAIQDIYSNYDLLNASEWRDYRFMLSVCRDLGLKPYIVVMSTNGCYYDYAGIDKLKRNACFTQMEDLAKKEGLDVLNLADQEYTPYFYCDGMHLGWKGWPYVSENLALHFGQ